MEVVLRKEDGSGCYQAYGSSEEDVFGKEDGAVRYVVEGGRRSANHEDC